ncbi:MAG: flagellar protein FliS, partial [Lachnospira sp.]|nr:flagellar protein FliS [Lachnospira sp.]
MTKEAIQTFSYRISQASRSELVVILYDMACGYLDDAKQILELNDEIRGEDSAVIDYIDALRKCGRVIDLLIKGLDFQYEISTNLLQIYLFIKQ